MNSSERKTLLLMKLVSTGFIITIVLVLFSLAKQQSNLNNNRNNVASVKIKLLQDINIKSLKDYPWHSENFSTAFINNKINYINYWAEWCKPCLTEIPYIKDLAKNFPQINFIFVNVDSFENLGTAQSWWKNNSKGTKTYYAENKGEILKYTRGLPYHQIYNTQKSMISHFTGNIDDKDSEIKELLNKILQFK